MMENEILTKEAIISAYKKNKKKMMSLKLSSKKPSKINIVGPCSLCGLDVNPLWYYPRSTDGPVYLCIGCKMKKEHERKRKKLNKKKTSKTHDSTRDVSNIKSEKYDPPTSIEERVTEGGLKNGYFRFKIPSGFFPIDSYGAKNKKIKEGKPISIFFEGPNINIKTDIEWENKKRIRSTKGFKAFYEYHKTKVNDRIQITRISERKYIISSLRSAKIDAPVLCKSQDELNIAVSKLKNITKPVGQNRPEKCIRESDYYVRDAAVVAFVLEAAKGVCECCMKSAPFCKEDNSPFLEIHHVHLLSAGGADTINNAVAVCPNCHKELHFGKNRLELIKKLYEKHKRLKK